MFSFLEEGASGVKADKSGAGLLKVWKLQLQQLHNLGPDMASAIVDQYPSPQALMQVINSLPATRQICVVKFLYACWRPDTYVSPIF